jgi:anti-sigma factor RsiW
MCYRTRRRIGAYLDGALGGRESDVTAAHLATCLSCHAELDTLKRLSAMLRHGVPSSAGPEWTGFWEGVRRGIEDGWVKVPAEPRADWWRRPRLVVGTAAALAVVASVAVWAPRESLTPSTAAISVSSADTDHPRGAVMIYSPPEKDLAVVWVFDLD